MSEEGLDIRFATWDGVERLFGRSGASNGCWCQYWLLGPDYHRRDRHQNRLELETQVRNRRAGLLAYQGETPVGWARLSRRSELPYLTRRFPAYDFGDEDPWTLPCFFVASRARASGAMTSLIRFATAWAATGRGEAIEAYPIDPNVQGATRNRFPGILRTFLDAGFTETGRLARDRAVVVRHPSE